jgi:hypothetical protein
MVLVLKKGATKEEIIRVSQRLKLKPKKRDLSRWCGIIKLKEDVLTIQKRMRDEWE